MSALRVALSEAMAAGDGAAVPAPVLQALAYPAAAGRAGGRALRDSRAPRLPKFDETLLRRFEVKSVRGAMKEALEAGGVEARDADKLLQQLVVGAFLAMAGSLTALIHPPKLCLPGTAVMVYVVYKSQGALEATHYLSIALALGLLCLLPGAARPPARVAVAKDGAATAAGRPKKNKAKKAD